MNVPTFMPAEKWWPLLGRATRLVDQKTGRMVAGLVPTRGLANVVHAPRHLELLGAFGLKPRELGARMIEAADSDTPDVIALALTEAA